MPDQPAGDDAPALPWLREPYDPEGDYPEPPAPPPRPPAPRASRVGLALLPVFVLALWLALAPFQAHDSTFSCGSPVLQPIGNMNLTDREIDKLMHDCPDAAKIRLQQAAVLAGLAGAVVIGAYIIDAYGRDDT